MLSRVADNLYWMSRYLERAEHTARLIDVNLDLMADRSQETVNQAWEKVYLGLGLPLPEQMPEAYDITQMLTFDATNDAAIVSHIAAARENARQVREQLSSEMWEQINRLYLRVKSSNIETIWQSQPHEFFQMVKEGAQLFQGIGSATMNHGEGWHFIKVGQYIERASNIAALLKAYLSEAPGEEQGPVSANQYVNWVGLLRSCTAFEAYCKVYTADPKYNCIAEFLLLNDEFPHSIHFSVKMMRTALEAIAEATDTRKNSQVYRRVGRLKAMLDYDQIDEVIGGDLDDYLDNVQRHCAQIHSAVYQTYINYPITEKLIA
ncbi:MAG: alpha-E domain-containing protein [Anaerolineae bacterium]|nr:alpha-E domain-containing protein [Anaerolineae bacterium]